MKYIDKLASLRQEMKEKAVDAYIIPSSDPHISEYLPERYKCIAWTSGFTGSAGTLAITQDFAGLWTDSRYFVQANEQLAGTGFELVKLQVQGKAEYASWLAKKLKKGDTVAFDGNLASVAVAQSVQSELEPLGINVNGHLDLLEPIWNNRPELPKEKAYLLDVASTGQSTKDKLAVVKEKLKDKRADLHFVSSLDDLAWILNIRGNDVHCNPVVLGFLLIETDKNTLFIDQEKLSSSDLASLKESGVEVSAYHLAFDAIKQVKGERILLDPKRTCFANYDSVPEGIEIIEDMNPSTLLKSIKNEVEINHTRHAMVKDGVALTKFFKWVEENVGSGELSEISIAEKLQDLRAASEGFVDISFDTIAGYKAHGALPHYKATDTSNSTLSAEGLLLVDSGGQYKDGTTDITRVISLGNITAEEKKDYTIVLKGTIEGSQAIFPVGTKGYSIDAITRRPIWETFRNYGHGTGHGVGYFLNVHEGPQVFNMAAIDIPVEEGMITSIEPGLYREGHYGIRIENLVLSKKVESNQFGEFMDFETLTICYIDTQLVDKSLLEQKHVDWLNKYNAWVYEQLSPKLEEAEKNWLKEKTKGI
ncbi:Xaa-Pro aminopeptidase [Sphingobacterium cellulitidis]|uniref:aminopeptidase P family protein n=1 Tax=Sphingobacterium cellulitidis TaxID=1768011 RepID=UPI000B93D9A4|nr:aminopeptidase P family protein [Sphingobacterium cellulitidis]OYD47238.1 Xaa-Pro aminopeptidase [Sphingobacterium cellulitidis]